MFPPPPVPGTGVESVYINDTYLEYSNQSTWPYYSLASYALHFDGPVLAPDWADYATWIGIERNTTGPFGFHEVEFTTTEFTHNIGPLPGWGSNPQSIPNCIAGLPSDEQYFLHGQMPNGDAVRVILNMTPDGCTPTPVYNLSETYILQHNAGVIFNYGTLANALAAADGITGVDFTEIASWDVVDSFIQGPETGNNFNVASIGNTSMSINAAVAGEAYDVCNESTYMYVNLFGALPNGDGVNLNIQVDAYTGPDPECFVPFGP